MRRLSLFVVVCAATLLVVPVARTQAPPPPTEAPAGFDDLTNGFLTQADFPAVKEIFDEIEIKAGGLGPVYNAQGCFECHQNPVTGGISQVTEMRAGHFDFVRGFTEHPGGSLLHSRAVDASFQERVLPGQEVRALRTSLNTLGDGFVEAIDSNTLIAISQQQPALLRGQVIQVPVLEANGALRVGRFGWKNQHASLLSFSADAYLNEMGITSPFAPEDNTSNGRVVDDLIPDPEDEGEDVEAFANFMRATKAPPRDTVLAATPAARAGSDLFNSIGCVVCHVRNIVTAPAGTVINGGAFTVPAALGRKLIHPFGDFLLHDVGTGDGIVQNGGPTTRNKLRTPPLWGLRTRNRLMHDGESLTFDDAIRRHQGQAAIVTPRWLFLTSAQRSQVNAFLSSL